MRRQSLAGEACVSPGATAWLSRLSDLLGRDEARGLVRPDCRRNVSGTGRPEWGWGSGPEGAPDLSPRPGPICPALPCPGLPCPGLPCLCDFIDFIARSLCPSDLLPTAPHACLSPYWTLSFLPQPSGRHRAEPRGPEPSRPLQCPGSWRGPGSPADSCLGRAPLRSWAGDAGGAPVSRLAPSGCWAASGKSLPLGCRRGRWECRPLGGPWTGKMKPLPCFAYKTMYGFILFSPRLHGESG